MTSIFTERNATAAVKNQDPSFEPNYGTVTKIDEGVWLVFEGYADPARVAIVSEGECRIYKQQPSFQDWRGI